MGKRKEEREEKERGHQERKGLRGRTRRRELEGGGAFVGKEVLIWASSKRDQKNRARSQVSLDLRGSFLGMDPVHYHLYFVFGYR